MYSTTYKEDIVDPMTMALLTSALGAAGSIGSGLLARNPKETRTQKQKRQLVDELISSLSGAGSFSELFEMDDKDFQKSFVDPAKSRFKTQIAPQIQQGFISGGQQRGTGLEDTLTRAGVDMDQLLNEQFMNFQQAAQNRRAGAIGQILGVGDGVQPGLSTGEKLQEGAAGFLSSDLFGSSLDRILEAASKTGGQNRQQLPREGFSL
jgi:hypothetical protein